jgi:hypothetical protein
MLMRQNKSKFRLAGAIGLLVATSAGLSAARGQGQNSAGQQAGSTGQSTQLLITHALDMALQGSDLQLTIRQAGCADAAGTTGHATSENGEKRAGGQDAASSGTAKPASEDGQACLIQVEQHVRKSFENSQELMTTSNRLLRAGSEAHGDRAKSSRLYAAANLYANSLYSIAGETFGWEAGWKPADRANGDKGQADKGEARQDKEHSAAKRAGSDEHRFTTADLTNVSLINHAVKESLSAFELSQSLRDMGANDAAAQHLRNHAKAMADEGRKSVNEIFASLHEKRTGTPGAANDRKTPGNRTGTASAESHAGWSGTQIRALAQQAREVVRVLDQLDGQAVAAPEGIRRSR